MPNDELTHESLAERFKGAPRGGPYMLSRYTVARLLGVTHKHVCDCLQQPSWLAQRNGANGIGLPRGTLIHVDAVWTYLLGHPRILARVAQKWREGMHKM